MPSSQNKVTLKNFKIKFEKRNHKLCKLEQYYETDNIHHSHNLDNNNCAQSFLRSCVNSEVIVLDRGIFLREHSSQRKIPMNSHNDRNKDGAKVLLSLITAI